MDENQQQPEASKPTIEEQNLRFERSKYWVEVFKWFTSSVVIVLVTLIIDTGFKERAAGIQEMQAYDKYVEVVLKANNIGDRWKLAEYFATVTPTDRLRQRWEDYKDVIEKDYKFYDQLKQTENQLLGKLAAAKGSDTISTRKLKEVQQLLAPLEKGLTTK